jgi:hypothetical protein
MPDQPQQQSKAQGSFDEFDGLAAQAEQLGLTPPRPGWTLDGLRSAVRAARQASAPVEQATAAPGEKRTLADRGDATDRAEAGADRAEAGAESSERG